MLVALSFAWGLTWPAMRIALDEIPPFSMRVVTLGLGAGALFAVARLQGRSFALGSAKNCAHLVVSAILNVLSFSLFSVIAMLFASTGRVAMLSYTMPIWAAVFAWFVLGERLTRARIVALAAVCRRDGDPDLSAAANRQCHRPRDRDRHRGELGGRHRVCEMGAHERRSDRQCGVADFLRLRDRHRCLPLFEGSLHLTQASMLAVFATIFAGLVGSGLAYFLWFNIIGRVPAMTASLGVLSAPVIGVLSTAVLLGEIPTAPDIVGYVLIFAASVCVLLPSREALPPEPS